MLRGRSRGYSGVIGQVEPRLPHSLLRIGTRYRVKTSDWYRLHDMAQIRLAAVYMKVPEGYVAFVEELPGANTQGETLEEARTNLEEAVAMVLDANRELTAQSLEGAEVIRETLIVPAA